MAPRRPASPTWTVDDSGFFQVDPDGTKKIILWSKLEKVDILTTADGPFSEDFFYILRGNENHMCIPQLRATEIKLLEQFARLPGFKWDEVARAAGSVDDNSFACWDRNWYSEPVNSGTS
jgi:hypothetical protein